MKYWKFLKIPKNTPKKETRDRPGVPGWARPRPTPTTNLLSHHMAPPPHHSPQNLKKCARELSELSTKTIISFSGSPIKKNKKWESHVVNTQHMCWYCDSSTWEFTFLSTILKFPNSTLVEKLIVENVIRHTPCLWQGLMANPTRKAFWSLGLTWF